jgi:hypothetical protein
MKSQLCINLYKIFAMKNYLFLLIIALTFALGNVKAQNVVEIRTTDSDISDNLDLEAVASIFGESEDLTDFEKRLNEAGTEISNLDLNEDGYVDYLRVIEYTENKTHLITIQAVLGDDLFQDVATIEVKKENWNRYSMIIVGNHFIYGNNYMIRPVYIHRPTIFSLFFGSHYHPWYSPYYWGYYPSYYGYRTPYPVYKYRDHIHGHINYQHHYEYVSHHNYHHSNDYYSRYGRNDYGSKHPEKSFENRNHGVKNRQELDQNRRSSQIKTTEYNHSEKSIQDKENVNRREVDTEKSRREGTSLPVNHPTTKSGQIPSENHERRINEPTDNRSKNVDRKEIKTTENKPAVHEKSTSTEVKRRANSNTSPNSSRVRSSSSKNTGSQNRGTGNSAKSQNPVKKAEKKDAPEKKSTENNSRR